MRRLNALLRLIGAATDRTSDDEDEGDDAVVTSSGPELSLLAREIEAVARYVAELKREIGNLRPNEVCSGRIPEALGDLEEVRQGTRAAAERIMSAAEAIMAADAGSADYRNVVESKVFDILEACAFQDIAGQRLARADAVLGLLKRRLERFSRAVKVSDAVALFDRDAIKTEVRREVLLVEGPQVAAASLDQDAVDRMFG